MPDATGTAKTIDQLPEKVSLLLTDMMAMDDGTQTYRVKWETMFKACGGIKSVETLSNSIQITLNDGVTQFSITTSDPNKQDKLTFDTAPTEGSTNPVTSGGIYVAVKTVQDDIEKTDGRIEANSQAIEAETQRAQTAEKANSDAIVILNSDSETDGSVANQVAKAIAALIAEAPASLDTLKEIADWIENHADDAAAMNSAIKANERAIAAEVERSEAAEKLISDEMHAYKNALGLYVDDEGYICQSIE